MNESSTIYDREQKRDETYKTSSTLLFFTFTS
jgi:hypothetical protein